MKHIKTFEKTWQERQQEEDEENARKKKSGDQSVMN